MASKLGKIDHIVYLMLENRSFDQMLGFLYSDAGNRSPLDHAFDGLTGNESNPDDTGKEIPVYKIQASDSHPYLMPGADPGEGFYNTNYQLFSNDDPAAGAVADNRGFVLNFKSAIASDLAKHYKDSLPGAEPSQIMGMYTPELLPVLSGLASGYAVCDEWFASAPTMTMPNRAFALAGTSQGHLDDNVKIFTCPSIFGRISDLGDAKVDWAIFGYNREPLTRHDFPDVQHASESHFGHFRDFQSLAASGKLPAFTFLEPSWDATGNSQHPNYDVAAGEQLIHDTYYALRNGRAWQSTLLIINYDEHGGNYDHVVPPSNATPPGDGTVGEYGFDFTRFGLRVPALLISPLIEAGTVFRAPKGKTIDHTSVLRTIHDRWGTKPLTKRDAAAPSLGDALTLDKPRDDDPLANVSVPVSSAHHQNSSTPSRLDRLQAARIAALPVRNEKGHYDTEPDPLPASTADLTNFIRDRSAAWSQHIQRQRNRRGGKHRAE
jgi:phospholipase C